MHICLTRSLIQCSTVQTTTEVEHKSHIRLTKDTWYLTPMNNYWTNLVAYSLRISRKIARYVIYWYTIHLDISSVYHSWGSSVLSQVQVTELGTASLLAGNHCHKKPIYIYEYIYLHLLISSCTNSDVTSERLYIYIYNLFNTFWITFEKKHISAGNVTSSNHTSAPSAGKYVSPMCNPIAV